MGAVFGVFFTDAIRTLDDVEVADATLWTSILREGVGPSQPGRAAVQIWLGEISGETI